MHGVSGSSAWGLSCGKGWLVLYPGWLMDYHYHVEAGSKGACITRGSITPGQIHECVSLGKPKGMPQPLRSVKKDPSKTVVLFPYSLGG